MRSAVVYGPDLMLPSWSDSVSREALVAVVTYRDCRQLRYHMTVTGPYSGIGYEEVSACDSADELLGMLRVEVANGQDWDSPSRIASRWAKLLEHVGDRDQHRAALIAANAARAGLHQDLVLMILDDIIAGWV